MLSSAALFPSLEPAAADAPTPRDALVLLVEDEDPLADLLTTLLSRMNVRVVRAADGAQALKLFEEHQASISLAFVDCHLPDTGGAELCRNLRGMAPGLPLLLTSGRDQRVLEAQLAAGGPCQFLPKPYMPGDVIRRVSALLSPGG